MTGELAGWKDGFGLLAYGPRSRRFRKDFQDVIGTPKAVSEFNDVMEKEAKNFVKRLAENPDSFLSHIQRLVVRSPTLLL